MPPPPCWRPCRSWTPAIAGELHVFELISFLVFAAEYVLRLWAAPEHPRYRGLPRHTGAPALCGDALRHRRYFCRWRPFGLVLMVNADLRTVALFRLIRFMKLARYSPGLASLVEAVRTERHALVACLGIIPPWCCWRHRPCMWPSATPSRRCSAPFRWRPGGRW